MPLTLRYPCNKLSFIAAAAFLLSGCGFSTQALMHGKWKMVSFNCDGTTYPVPDSIEVLLTYERENGSGASLLINVEDRTCVIEKSGSYTWSGLNVTQRHLREDCPGGCTVPGFEPANRSIECIADGSEFSEARVSKFKVNIPQSDVMEHFDHSPGHLFCPDTAHEEQQQYIRIE